MDLTGFESFDIIGIHDEMKPGAEVMVTAKSSDGKVTEFKADGRLDTPVEVNYYRHGWILNAVLRKNLISL